MRHVGHGFGASSALELSLAIGGGSSSLIDPSVRKRICRRAAIVDDTAECDILSTDFVLSNDLQSLFESRCLISAAVFYYANSRWTLDTSWVLW